MMLVLLFPLSTVVNSQEYHYKAEIGDKNEYRYDKVLYMGELETRQYMEWSNGTSSFITVKTGDTYTMEVCGFNTLHGYLGVNTSKTVNGQTTKCSNIYETYVYPDNISDYGN